LTRCADAGEVIPELLRGQIGLKPAAQAALIFVRQQLGIVARTALKVTSLRWVDDDHAEVRVTGPQGALTVAVETEIRSAAQLTCRGPENVRARVYRGTTISTYSR